jgi:hypothetical protein
LNVERVSELASYTRRILSEEKAVLRLSELFELIERHELVLVALVAALVLLVLAVTKQPC